MALAGGLLICSLAVAQIGGFSQRGKVVQGLPGDELAIAHPSLPLNSTATLKNTWNDKEVEVTVVGRIAADGSRIADVTSGVWDILRLTPDAETVLYTLPPPAVGPLAPSPGSRPPSSPGTTEIVDMIQKMINDREKAAAAAVAHSSEVSAISAAEIIELLQQVKRYQEIAAMQEPSRAHPVNITLYNHVIKPDMSSREQEYQADEEPDADSEAARAAYTEHLKWLVTTIRARNERQVQEESYPSGAAPDAIPALPNPDGGKAYRLQVGVFTERETVNTAAQLLRSAGFSVAVKHEAGVLYRVEAVNVPAAMVSSAVNKLGTLGFRQIHVYE